MEYRVKYACGHESTTALFGTGETRRRRMLDYGMCLCPLCARREGRRPLMLVELEGTRSQRSWAEQIRQQFIAAYLEETADTPPEVSRRTDRAYARLLENGSARWWVDHRGADPLQLVRLAASGLERLDRSSTAVRRK